MRSASLWWLRMAALSGGACVVERTSAQRAAVGGMWRPSITRHPALDVNSAEKSSRIKTRIRTTWSWCTAKRRGCDFCFLNKTFDNILTVVCCIKVGCPGVQEVEGGFQCLECGTSMKHLRNYKRHMADKHSGIGPLPCTYCGKTYSSNNSLMTHMYSFHREQYLLDRGK